MKTYSLTVGLMIALAGQAGTANMTKQEYVSNWKETAIEQMIQFRIPASITLAQGILESGSGNSELARKGNNHFGIKCHGWTGEKIYLNDDSKGECFRVYKTAVESYKDHSEFLNHYERYSFLFNLEIDDYKSWAKGLKDAGYATNPKYPELLIGIIEDLKLNELDKSIASDITLKPQIVLSTQQANEHMVLNHEQKVKYVVAKKGDTFFKIAQEFGLSLRQLYKYNNFDTSKDVLEPGDVIYLQPKRRRKLFRDNEVVLDKEMSVQEISQKYATNYKSLKRLNDFEAPEEKVSKGVKVILR